jgi:glycosyltransferase involved in cell wall biosynthesis
LNPCAVRYAILVPGSAAGRADIAAGRAPRRDYLDVADALGAKIIEIGPRWSRGALRSGLAAAWTAFRRRGEYDVIVTMAERSGIPLALLLRLGRARRGHVMIAHWLSPAKKRLALQWSLASSAIDRIVVYGTTQERVAVDRLKLPQRRVRMIRHAADAEFWHPLGQSQSGICSAGLERRDYGTLVEAVRGLDLTVTIAAANPWTTRDPLATEGFPTNVVKRRVDHHALRDLYDRSEFVVVPLKDVDFQAGSLVTYEAMAMGKAVIATRTRALSGGDLVRDGETGILVPPGDVGALREAILRLHNDPAEARRLGANARRIVEAGLNHERYIHDMVGVVREVGQEMGGATCA